MTALDYRAAEMFLDLCLAQGIRSLVEARRFVSVMIVGSEIFETEWKASKGKPALDYGSIGDEFLKFLEETE